MSMIDYEGGEMLGGGKNKWTDFVKKNAGRGMTLQQLSKLYHSSNKSLKKTMPLKKNQKPHKTKISHDERFIHISFDKKAMTPAQKQKFSRFLYEAHGSGIGSSLGSVFDSVFGLGGEEMGGMPLGGMSLGGYHSDNDEFLGKGIGSSIGSVVDHLFGLGVKHKKKHMAHNRGGFNLMDLAPLMLL